MSVDTKLILSLINRVAVRLPSNSGRRLESLEADPLMQQTVAALIELSKFRLSTIANQLVSVLENVSKSSSLSIDDYVPYDVLQSQLFLLRMLSACMQHHWKSCRESASELEDPDDLGLDNDVRSLSSNEDNSSENGQDQSNGLPPVLEDPPALDEPLAKYIVNVLMRFIHQMASVDDKAFAHYSNNTPGIARSEQHYFPSNTNSSTGIIIDIYKAACRVIFYTSASNWNVVFAKVKARIMYLTTTSEEYPETSDLRLLECSALDSKRLTMVLTTLCSSFLHMKKNAQLAIAVSLRRAIWGWIETYPAEFVQLCQSQRRLEGSPEILFDICNSLADTSKRKAILWPLQTMLLILCPDVLMAATMSEGRGVQSKKSIFLDTLRKTLRGSRSSDLASICYVDIFKASTYVSKSDTSALRHMVPEVENELKEKLFDINRHLSSDNSISNIGIYIDQRALMSDCLTALFRLNPRNTVRTLVPICLDDRAPLIFKLSLLKACLTIASEENWLLWNPSISIVYTAIAAPLRKLFLELVKAEYAKSETSLLTNSSRKLNLGSNEKNKRKELQLESDQKYELLLDLLRLYRVNPMLAIMGEEEDRFEQNCSLMLGITNCLRDRNHVIRMAAADCLFKLHTPSYIIRWNQSGVMMETFWKISSVVVLDLSKQILDNRERDDSLKSLLDLLRRLLATRNDFIRAHQDIALNGADIRERLQASVALEIALLVLLCSADTEICSGAITCFGYLCAEADLTDCQDSPVQSPLTIVENLPVYVELSTSGGVVTGRKAQQKRIRKLLRMISNYTPGNLAAWEEAWKRWKILTQIMTKPVEESREEVLEQGKKVGSIFHDKLNRSVAKQTSTVFTRIEIDEERSLEWQNYTGFLAALGGCCLMSEASSSPSPTKGKNRAASINSDQYRRSTAPGESAGMVDKFIMEMVDLLVSDNVLVREVVKETLGADLSPGLFVILFRHLESVLSRCFDATGEAICSERYTLFVEQAISVLKLVLDRIVDPSDSLFTVDFSGLINQYAMYLNKLGTNHVALRIKVKMCQLCEVLMSKKDHITLRQEIKLRNKLLEIIVEWTSDFSLKPDTQSTFSSVETSQNEKLHRDLDQACLKTIVALLHQLPLQPPDPVHETDLGQVKSRLFYKYFTFFLKLLNRCRISEIESSQQSQRNTPDLNLNRTKGAAAKDLGSLKDYTILAMSNLLSANVDAGLKYSLSMGYHEDTRTRTAFMQVLTNILNQGTEFETLAETALTDRYEKLVDMIVDSDLTIALSLCDVCPMSDLDEVAHILLTCFESRQKTLPLLKAVIEREVANTESETELFRRTSMATRLLSAYAKTYGSEYMKTTLHKAMETMVNKPAEAKTFELDPSKVESGEDIARNKQNVIDTTDLFLNAICASTNDAPRSFREICHYILSSVRERFPEAKYTAVGGFIFLRFFCPAIVSPEAEGLFKLPQPQTREIRRGQLIVTKVIQNLANNILFGAKETYMIILNDFLTSNIYKVTNFLREMSNLPPVASPVNSEDSATQMEEKDYAKLHRYLFDNLERMTRDLAARKPLNQDADSAQGWKKSFDKFSTLLAQLGRPPEIPQSDTSVARTYTHGASNQLYTEFMRRNSHRNIDPVSSKNIFFEGGVSKAGRPVFYFITRNVSADSIDFELLIYHVLQVMERSLHKPVELLFDVTQFNPSNEIPNQWLNQLLQLLPPDIHENISTIYIYNANSHLRKYTKKLPRPVTYKIGKRIVFAVTLAELHEHIAPSEVRLPKSTVALETDPSAVFFPVSKLSHYRTVIAVTIKVGLEYIQIMTVRKQELFYGLNAVTNDVYHISSIDDISLVPQKRHGEDPNEFIIKYDKGKSSMTLSTAKRDAIVSVLRHNKQRYEISKPTNISERIIRPNDVPGRLLNMALLNIGSEDPNLRLAAYNLLYALSLTFRFDVGNQLLDAKDLCIPANSTGFIIAISEKLAVTEPSLTLEFLNECFVGFNKSSEPLRHLCLDYMAPWLPNLSIFARNSPEDGKQTLTKTKEVIRLLIDLTVTRNDMYNIVQAKIWKTLGKVDDLINLVLDAFVHFSVEHGVGSAQTEAMADTFVTLSNVAVRGKVIARLRKVLQRTSLKPSRILTEHPAWTEIAVLIRFILMLSFNIQGPVKPYIPEIFHIVSMLAATGPTLIRTSVHGLVVNVIQTACTTIPLPEGSLKKMQFLLTDISDSKHRLLFGLTKPHANAFTITQETMTDVADSMPLASLEAVVHTLLEALTFGAPSMDVANMWRARWMSLVTSSAFQFNPAIQPRAFVVLGCLAQEEVDDDLLYQILVALRGALAIFNESDSNLITSIMMCLKNIVESLPADSRYLQQLFWLAMALVQINHPATFATAVDLLQAALRALDANGFFNDEPVIDVLMAAREPLVSVARLLDEASGVNFETHFSFAVAGILMKGMKHSNPKNTVFQGLTTFLDIECKHTMEQNIVESKTLGYLAGLLPIAAKNLALKELLRLAGINDVEIENSEVGTTYFRIFDKLDIPNNTTALLLVSLLVTMLNSADNETERLFLYGILAEAAVAIPEVFALIYDNLLPRMNQIVVSSQTHPIIDSVKSILYTACSEPVFNQAKTQNRSQKAYLEELGFSALGDPVFGAGKTNVAKNAKLASELVELIIA